MLVFAALCGYLTTDRTAMEVAAPLLLGTVLMAGGAMALNQVLEMKGDALMRRTRMRPLPSRAVSMPVAVGFGLGISCMGVLLLAVWTTVAAAGFAVLAWVLYLFFYTPLKRVSRASVFIGAAAGALPPVIGSAAAGVLDWQAAWLFAMLFAWQIPHVFAIAQAHRDDYLRAGIKTPQRWVAVVFAVLLAGLVLAMPWVFGSGN